MEAPKKIYLVKDENTDKPMDYWYNATTDDSKVEYTRTDAFIEKACEWLGSKFTMNDTMSIVSFQTYAFDSIEEMFEDLKNYIKGE